MALEETRRAPQHRGVAGLLVLHSHDPPILTGTCPLATLNMVPGYFSEILRLLEVSLGGRSARQRSHAQQADAYCFRPQTAQAWARVLPVN